jgi:hypothetical protein
MASIEAGQLQTSLDPGVLLMLVNQDEFSKDSSKCCMAWPPPNQQSHVGTAPRVTMQVSLTVMSDLGALLPGQASSTW